MAMLKFLELCQSSSWAQIMFPYQDLSNGNLPLNMASWRGFCIKCCISGRREADDPSAGHWWTLSIRWTYPQGLGFFCSRSLRWKVQCKSCSPDVGRERKAFPFTSCTSSKLPFPNLGTVSAPFFIQT